MWRTTRTAGLALLPLLAAAVAAGAAHAPATRPVPRGADADVEAAGLLGAAAPPLPALRWLDGKARSSRSLAGQVVVIRNFTEGCPFCEGTLPALAQLDRDLRKRGLVVLGVYHPKPPRPVTDQEAQRHAQALGATFPVAVDPDWALVKRWWLDRGPGHWTSITWVLDRRGRVRWVHPGGEYHQGGGEEHARCRADEQELRATVTRLLGE